MLFCAESRSTQKVFKWSIRYRIQQKVDVFLTKHHSTPLMIARVVYNGCTESTKGKDRVYSKWQRCSWMLCCWLHRFLTIHCIWHWVCVPFVTLTSCSHSIYLQSVMHREQKALDPSHSGSMKKKERCVKLVCPCELTSMEQLYMYNNYHCNIC